MNDGITTVVIDNGSGWTKAGFAGDDAPKCVFSADILNIRSPIVGGTITNWDDMEKIWNHTFYNELKVDPSETQILLTEATNNDKKHREKILEIMYHNFSVYSIQIVPQPVLSLYASGLTTGTVLETGHELTQTVSIHEGKVLPGNAYVNVGGFDVENYLMKLLNDRGYSSVNKEIARDIKEKFAYVAFDFEAEMNGAVEKSYQLPDGQEITIGNEAFKCSEILFNPALNPNSRGVSIHESQIYTIQHCDNN